jgi:hypothetical protein
VLHDLFLQNRMRDTAPKDEAELKQTLVSLIQLNQAYSLVFATFAERTYRSLRNGVIILVLALAVVVFDSAFSPSAAASRSKPPSGARGR